MSPVGVPFSGLPEEFARMLLEWVVEDYGGDFAQLYLEWEGGYLSEEHMDQVYEVAEAEDVLDELEEYVVV